MGIYTKVVSIVKPIDDIKVSVGGSLKNIESAWIFVKGVRKQVFPTTEKWTLIYENTNPGIYEKELGWGKYKITFSGGGGAGGAAAYGSGGHAGQYANNGSAGEEKTFYYSVGENKTVTLSGIIGTGAAGSYAKGLGDQRVPLDICDAEAGAAGTGYDNGKQGSSRIYVSRDGAYDGYGAAGGSGGGSSSVSINGSLYSTARGGNGGEASARTSAFPAQGGGQGGSGGVSNGTGAAGGTGKTFYKDEGTSGAGANGYVRIYISNMKP